MVCEFRRALNEETLAFLLRTTMVINLLQIAYTNKQTSHHWSNTYSILLEHFVWSPLRSVTDNSLRPQYLALLNISRTSNSSALTLQDFNTCLITFEEFIRTKNLSTAYRNSILQTFEFIFDQRNTYVQTRLTS